MKLPYHGTSFGSLVRAMVSAGWVFGTCWSGVVDFHDFNSMTVHWGLLTVTSGSMMANSGYFIVNSDDMNVN